MRLPSKKNNQILLDDPTICDKKKFTRSTTNADLVYLLIIKSYIKYVIRKVKAISFFVMHTNRHY